MESELSGIFQVKVVTKNIVLGSLGTQRKAAVLCLFLKKHTNFWAKLLHLSVFLVKQYTNSIYVERMSFCLVNWAFPFGFLGTHFMQESCKNISFTWGLQTTLAVLANYNWRLRDHWELKLGRELWHKKILWHVKLQHLYIAVIIVRYVTAYNISYIYFATVYINLKDLKCAQNF